MIITMFIVIIDYYKYLPFFHKQGKQFKREGNNLSKTDNICNAQCQIYQTNQLEININNSYVRLVIILFFLCLLLLFIKLIKHFCINTVA